MQSKVQQEIGANCFKLRRNRIRQLFSKLSEFFERLYRKCLKCLRLFSKMYGKYLEEILFIVPNCRTEIVSQKSFPRDCITKPTQKKLNFIDDPKKLADFNRAYGSHARTSSYSTRNTVNFFLGCLYHRKQNVQYVY